jgi:hypothetical protein
MTEVQAHGNFYEDKVIFERTGRTKKEYDTLKGNGYTSKLDIVNGLLFDYNGSVKCTIDNTINCGDIMNMITQREYRLIVGTYNQIGDNKVFHTEYEFFIKDEHYPMLWADTNLEKLKEYIDKIKSVKYYREGQKEYQLKYRKLWKSEVSVKGAMFVINPKVDSKEQRRVQCSIHLRKLLSSGIYYTKKDINYSLFSPPRRPKSKNK